MHTRKNGRGKKGLSSRKRSLKSTKRRGPPIKEQGRSEVMKRDIEMNISKGLETGLKEPLMSINENSDHTSKPTASTSNLTTSSGPMKDLTTLVTSEQKKPDLEKEEVSGSDLRDLLFQTLKDVRSGKMSPDAAVAVGRMSKEILSSVRAELGGISSLNIKGDLKK